MLALTCVSTVGDPGNVPVAKTPITESVTKVVALPEKPSVVPDPVRLDEIGGRVSASTND